MKDIKEVVKYIGEVESKLVHRNEGEEDITCPYGIYLKPNSRMYQYIVELAESLDIDKDTKEWNNDDIKIVNSLVEKSAYGVQQLAEGFYRDFLKDAHMELFPKECQVAMYSMYTNSPKNAWKAVQEALLEMSVIFNFPSNLSSIDGSYGEKTKNGLDFITSLESEGYHFETRMLSNMKSIYIKLWKSNPDKYGRYLSGWDNRMSHLEMSK